MRKRKLKIAQLVLPWIPLPPPGYAGTEWIVYWLTEELTRRGHKVTLFSVGESKTRARLYFLFKKSLGLQPDVMRTLKSSFYPLMHVASCFEKQDEFDIIHSHAQFLALPFAAVSKTPSLHTFHRIFKFESKEEEELVKHYAWLNFTSISNSQRIPGINFIATVYNGVPVKNFKFSKKPGKYLLWVGRIIDKKGPKEAILVAKKLKMKLIMIGKITQPEYFEKEIKPEIDGKLINYLGELPQKTLRKYYTGAYCTLFPVKWPEPFGLVAVESMASGTPVVAFSNGGARETIVHKKTGFLVKEKEGISGLVEGVKNVDSIKREGCREWVEENFTVEKMADDYEKIYYKLTKK